MHKKNMLVRLLLLVFGLYLCGVGLTFFYYNGLGLDGWNVLHDGLSKLFNVKIGTAFVTVSIIMLTLGILMKEKLGIATIANALLIGNFMQININLGLLKPQTDLLNGLLFTLIGMIITGFGYYFYMGVGLGSGPRDSFVMAVSRKINLKVGYVKSIIEVIAIILGYLIGGDFGISTIIIAIFTGITVQKVFDLLKFNPKAIEQESITDVLEKLKK
ncbi:MAG: hypothetical protein GXY89_10175 [Tissierellia bacterium]|jgi:uncharacterized membrane protein YczE|nr:hypothetical protein [Tissierellia bacterium]